MRSGKIVSNDYLIDQILNDSLYDIRNDGMIMTQICRTGKISVKGVWREAGSISGGYRFIYYKGHKLSCHRIMYKKFNGMLSEDLVINHLDGNRLNNNPKNLELTTVGGNNLHSYRSNNREPSFGHSKINQGIADDIRTDRTAGLTLSELSEKYNLCKSNVSYIINNRTWKKVCITV